MEVSTLARVVLDTPLLVTCLLSPLIHPPRMEGDTVRGSRVQTDIVRDIELRACAGGSGMGWNVEDRQASTCF